MIDFKFSSSTFVPWQGFIFTFHFVSKNVLIAIFISVLHTIRIRKK